MHIEIMTEEPSAEADLQHLMAKIVGKSITFTIHQHGDKPTLLASLPGRLRGYASWLPDDWRNLVLVDLDDDDCSKLKKRLEEIASEARLPTPSTAKSPHQIRVYNRILIEELEAWFFGDPIAIAAAYPRVSRYLGQRSKFRVPDAIRGGTWEALERVLQKAGYYKTGLAKIEAAQLIAQHMEPARNTSRSFRLFRDTLCDFLRLETGDFKQKG